MVWIRAVAVRYYPVKTCNICRCLRTTFTFGNNYVKVFFGSPFCSFETILPVHDYSAVERRSLHMCLHWPAIGKKDRYVKMRKMHKNMVNNPYNGPSTPRKRTLFWILVLI